jgi:hypothetical protein
MKLVKLIKTCLYETYNKAVWLKIRLIYFLFKMVYKKGMNYRHCFWLSFRIRYKKYPRKWDKSAHGLC